MAQFRTGEINTLVSTSIGEEGLDVGECDLIVAFDTTGSPVRRIQHIGRTGRQRQGRVVALVMEGVQARQYEQAKKKVDIVAKTIRTKLKQGELPLYPDNPRMLPSGIQPRLERLIFESVEPIPGRSPSLRPIPEPRTAAAGRRQQQARGSKSVWLTAEEKQHNCCG